MVVPSNPIPPLFCQSSKLWAASRVRASLYFRRVSTHHGITCQELFYAGKDDFFKRNESIFVRCGRKEWTLSRILPMLAISALGVQ